jgi:hypothetical protein
MRGKNPACGLTGVPAILTDQQVQAILERPGYHRIAPGDVWVSDGTASGGRKGFDGELWVDLMGGDGGVSPLLLLGWLVDLGLREDEVRAAIAYVVPEAAEG